MYDALPGAFHTIPADAQLVAGYIDGGPGYPVMTDDLWQLYPNAIHVPIATQPGTNAGIVLDVESGDATPDQAPGWARMRRAAGARPSIYCSESAWDAVARAFIDQAEPMPAWWIAGYPGSVGAGNLYPGAVAHQWGGNAAGEWDVSAVADYWPGVDPEPAPPKPTPKGDDAVLYSANDPGQPITYFRDAGGVLVPLAPEEAAPYWPAVQAGEIPVVHLGGTLAAVAFSLRSAAALKKVGL